MSNQNFTIRTGDDGTWFNFKASDGTEALINVENLIEKFKSGMVKKTLTKWCEDRRNGPPLSHDIIKKMQEVTIHPQPGCSIHVVTITPVDLGKCFFYVQQWGDFVGSYVSMLTNSQIQLETFKLPVQRISAPVKVLIFEFDAAPAEITKADLVEKIYMHGRESCNHMDDPGALADMLKKEFPTGLKVI